MSSVRLYCKKVGVGIPIGLIQRLTRTAVPVQLYSYSWANPTQILSILPTVRVRLYTEDRGQRTQDTEAKAANSRRSQTVCKQFIQLYACHAGATAAGARRMRSHESIRHALLSGGAPHIGRHQQQSAVQHLEAHCTAQSAAPTLEGLQLVKGLQKPHCGHPSPAGARRALRRGRARMSRCQP
jgi:hypothetical protein